MSYRLTRRFLTGAMLLGVVLLLVQPVVATPPAPGSTPNFIEAAPQGLGDRHNSMAWWMQWWRDKLYVGTLRSFICWESASLAATFPRLASLLYPPHHQDADCTDSPADLPMRAEIWRWTPETDAWERVYQPAEDVPIPGHLGKYVAPDIGFRGMLVFTESDGTEALYVSGVSPRTMYSEREQLPPRAHPALDGRRDL